ncbi:ABC transporter ATP-binding protein [Haloarcula japonica]|uniref:Branched-chain amino acid ABC transporter ATP-binding protein n=1 Tax=Haloarcula japonica (strain ATCC 49778 / DSM 6131 / JCM 7785 / NBRC 101032 / NCIMB 13157 / TR-1) TaxID=1227453 RepID=M0LIP3_HALJT|nr:ABC transporter ATP-binding protein [Haloarcula japonica]EMA33482.1 branched-chain amino acid ABC transporter ATP-binding protein [Haloarcula japonica DSM 6131]
MSLLQLDNVHSYYGPSHILRGISVTIEKGEIVTLLGRNGAGKTTTVRSIAGTEPPDVRSGTIRFDGTDITDWPADDIAMGGIGVVPEGRRLFSELTVEENLEMSKITRGWWNTIRRGGLGGDDSTMSLTELYDLFPRLEERREQEAGTLSGGEQQMLSIARTLRLPDLQLLLLDEPTEGLAPQIVETVGNSIEEIASQGLTVLLIEQNVREALRIADRGYVLDQGDIVYEGSVEQLENEDLDEYLVV